MAGDWLKMRTDLWTNPHVVRIVSACNAQRCSVIGALFRLWSLADAHTEDGFLAGYTRELIDEEVGLPGFATACYMAGWLDITTEGVTVPRFTKHNGRPAKRRAQESSRKQTARKTSASNADKKRTREEKRREEKSVSSEEDTKRALQFDLFWPAYPLRGGRRLGKAEAKAEFIKLPDEYIPRIMVAVQHYFDACNEPGAAAAKDAFRWLRKPPRGKGGPPWLEWEEPPEATEAAGIQKFDLEEPK